MQLSLLPYQAEFVNDITTRNIALVGGYGTGKTQGLCNKLLVLAHLNPGYEGIAMSPTYQMAIKVLIPTMKKVLNENKISFVFNKTEMLFTMKIYGKDTLLHILASETFERAAGINAAFFGVDEADLLDTDTFFACWRMLRSRLRRGLVFQGAAASTPEGFKGIYKYFVEEPAQKPLLVPFRRIIKASTYENFYLPKSYIEELENSYPEHLIKAYLHGEFVHLAGKPVYWKFDKERNLCTFSKDDFQGNVLHIGIDFNAGINATVVHAIKNNICYAVDEIYGMQDSQKLADEIRTRYPKQYNANALRFYPDIAGFEGIQTLKRNFAEFGPDGKPNFRFQKKDVAKRVTAVNTKFLQVGGGPESFVNPIKCPNLYKGLLQQVYDKNQEPDTKAGLEHALDAHGYFIHKMWPVTERVTAQISS